MECQAVGYLAVLATFHLLKFRRQEPRSGVGFNLLRCPLFAVGIERVAVGRRNALDGINQKGAIHNVKGVKGRAEQSACVLIKLLMVVNIVLIDSWREYVIGCYIVC